MHILAKSPTLHHLQNATHRLSLTYGVPFLCAALKPLAPSLPSVGPIPVGPLPFLHAIPHRCALSFVCLESGPDRPRQPTRPFTGGLDLLCIELCPLPSALFPCGPVIITNQIEAPGPGDILSLGSEATATDLILGHVDSASSEHAPGEISMYTIPSPSGT